MAMRHDGIDGQGQWLAQVLRGWMAYLCCADERLGDLSLPPHDRTLARPVMRRSQRRRLTWRRMKTIADRYLPFPRILHPWPEKRFLVTIQGGSPMRLAALAGICAGGGENLRSYRDRLAVKDFLAWRRLRIRCSHVSGLT